MSGNDALIPLPDHIYLDRAAQSGRSVQQEVAAGIESGEMPIRYQRNAETIRPMEQATLARSRILLVGCGGLGGHVLEFLVRAGVGTILACDPDRFDLTNANRQVLATSDNLGRTKVEVAVERAERINPLVRVVPLATDFRKEESPAADLVVDCLGGAECRRDLQRLATEAKVPLVSAGISGWTALVSTTWPGETGLAEFMNEKQAGSELVQGVPSPVAGFAASLQATEVLRILTGHIPALRGSLLLADLSEMRFSSISLQTGLDFSI
ncbi:HesA/MoeB/ThiF family protein [Desulfomicrobium baculatum]|uniref:UBA/THIF-type NAD/FAD binding protein n=1 Tax=Desulfomicrobium baculatum (strain DSM 4028 / VKM B-1378 / X) TaxID=525897 RepID=C7LPK8_DESBD|nr:ThiF family adenylyltransferase [Desulfomicrobium baculatum]ACU90237.1 UBA/THIF-type NAD/FAD binding protein [Desulfomicrobium baculatum DSM 4028]